MYFEDALTNVYVVTKTYEEAKAKLAKDRVLIISGHPGEGKTAMSTKLVSEVSSPEKCLKLRVPSDWAHVDLTLDIFDCIFIDDIFGAGVLDEKSLNKWKKYLLDIEMLVRKNKSLKVIITTRHYILEDAKPNIEHLTLFKSENVHVLTSKSISSSERAEILKVHMEQKEREIKPGFIKSCVDASDAFFEKFVLHDRNFLFGFPECVNMFVNNDELFQKGSMFFQKPNEFFKRCIQDLYRNQDKFLALVMIWSDKEKSLAKSKLDISSMSYQLRRIAKKFGFKPKAKLNKILRKSLEHHSGGFLDFDPKTGVYSFSHNVIDDMIGLVLSKDYPKETLEFCSREFIMEYITTDTAKNDDFHFYVDKSLYENLHAKLVDMLLFTLGCPAVLEKTRGLSPKRSTVYLELDKSVLIHSVFSDRTYVQTFVQYLVKNKLFEKVLTTTVMTMYGYNILSYGIVLEEVDVFLPSYSLSNGNSVLFLELMQQNKRQYKGKIEMKEKDMAMSLIFAAHKELKDVVEFLLLNGSNVNEDVIQIASQKENTEILSILLQKRRPDAVGSGHGVNGNNALIVASQKGLTKSVQCLVDHGVDISYRNNDTMSALDKAIAYKHEDICKILIEKGAQLNIKAGKFKRTPLHVASDIGLLNTAKLLVRHGASVNIKDHRGHYAIHCAAFQGHTHVVKALMQHDKSQAKLRITSYGSKSVLKSMTVCHIAVWKNNHEMIDALVGLGADFEIRDRYGRTPFYCAVYNGDVELVMKLTNVCDVSAAEKQGFTPLHAAVHKRHEKIISHLCPRVDVNARDKFGKTPLHVACENGNATLALELVKKFGADMRMRTKRGDTVFHIFQRMAIKPHSLDDLIRQLDVLMNKKVDKLDQKLEKCFDVVLGLDKEFETQLERLPNKY